MSDGFFHGEPVVRSLQGPSEYLIVQTPSDWFGFKSRDGRWLVPRNKQNSDQGSIPRLLDWWIPRDSFWGFYPHDDIYAHHSIEIRPTTPDGLPDMKCDQSDIAYVYVTRGLADSYLLEMMMAEIDMTPGPIGGSMWAHVRHRARLTHMRFKARTVYAFVVAFGWAAWNRKRLK